jgi:very-long-chain enoyl-CoA reductase
VIFHYLKRELETLFVHRFGNDTMPWTNIFKNSFHYWGIFGICCMYFFLKPGNPPQWQTKNLTIILGAIFMIFEALNFQTHLILRNLRRPGTTERNIPEGCGFGLVSCANYLWETLAWLVFAILAQTWGSYLFLAVASG